MGFSPLGSFWTEMYRKAFPQCLKANDFVRSMYGLKPIPFIDSVFPQPVKPH
jgi:hypothetical protein